MSYFSSPIRLSVVGQAAGLSAPYRMSALVGKTVYNVSAAATVLPTTLGLSTFNGKRFGGPVNQGIVTTLAGSGAAGGGNGTGTGASFYNPATLVVDASGNVIVAGFADQNIRKISFPNGLILNGGVVTTLAGSGLSGWVDGTGTGASFWSPAGVAIDANGNIIVADTANNRIRKVTSSGVVTTLAGSGSSAFADGTGAGASFSNPRGVAIDTDGNIIVADLANHRIRKVTPSGVVTTIAGSGSGQFSDGTGSGASFWFPRGVSIDANGNIIVADLLNHRIRKVTNPGGVVTTLAGSGSAAFADGTGTGASFSGPSGVATDTNGNIIVGDTDNHRIRKVTNPGGVVTTIAGSGSATFADGTGAGASFSSPWGVAVDASGNIFVADSGNNRIRKIS